MYLKLDDNSTDVIITTFFEGSFSDHFGTTFDGGSSCFNIRDKVINTI
jgi:hypothetical protein